MIDRVPNESESEQDILSEIKDLVQKYPDLMRALLDEHDAQRSEEVLQ